MGHRAKVKAERRAARRALRDDPVMRGMACIGCSMLFSYGAPLIKLCTAAGTALGRVEVFAHPRCVVDETRRHGTVRVLGLSVFIDRAFESDEEFHAALGPLMERAYAEANTAFVAAGLAPFAPPTGGRAVVGAQAAPTVPPFQPASAVVGG